MKTCITCKVSQSSDRFHRNRTRSDGLASECKSCCAAKSKTSYGDGESYRLRMYNLTDARYRELLIAQNDTCAICGRDEPLGIGTWHVDHDHACCPGKKSCGKCVRGLLCKPCNHGLGIFNDNTELLHKAATYVMANRDVLTQG